MLEDKLKFTDWEATNEAIEEHVSFKSEGFKFNLRYLIENEL